MGVGERGLGASLGANHGCPGLFSWPSLIKRRAVSSGMIRSGFGLPHPSECLSIDLRVDLAPGGYPEGGSLHERLRSPSSSASWAGIAGDLPLLAQRWGARPHCQLLEHAAIQ